TLNCLVLGGKSRNVFPVEIASTKNIGVLKDLIKSKNQATFRDVDAHALILWKAPESLLCDDDALPEMVEALNLQDEKSSHPVNRLSRIFSDPDPDHLHIIVKAPETITLNCLVLGGNSRNVFPVEIASTKNIGVLKDLIKSKKQITFCDVDADALVLWGAPESLLCNDDALKATTKGLHLEAKDALFPASRLSQIFPAPPNPDYLHIVVEAP
ncbi:hypothetical protein BU15DRAFT_18022, partial [Melanogaster broomeanus]